MKDILIRKFVKDRTNLKNPQVRQSYGNLASSVGIIMNLILSGLKLMIGYISGSIAIISDAVNNMADAGSSLVTFASFKISGKAADSDHPYGHGRAEYLFSIAVAVVIMFVGVQFFVQSARKVMYPEPVDFSLWTAAVLILSIFIKVWLYYFYKYIGEHIDSPILKATSMDSLSDVLITTVVLIGLIGGMFVDFPVDGYLGSLVSLAIIRAGFDVFKESTSSLVGREPSKELVLEIARKLKGYEGVCGIHDLMVHDYGPGNTFVTVHVEVKASVDILVSHEIIDQIEKDFLRDMGIRLTIHMDPIMDDAETLLLFQSVSSLVKGIDIRYSIHDFRVVKKRSEKILIFDLLIPYDEEKEEKEIELAVKNKIMEWDNTYEVNITIEQSYTGDLNIHG